MCEEQTELIWLWTTAVLPITISHRFQNYFVMVSQNIFLTLRKTYDNNL